MDGTKTGTLLLTLWLAIRLPCRMRLACEGLPAYDVGWPICLLWPVVEQTRSAFPIWPERRPVLFFVIFVAVLRSLCSSPPCPP